MEYTPQLEDCHVWQDDKKDQIRDFVKVQFISKHKQRCLFRRIWSQCLKERRYDTYSKFLPALKTIGARFCTVDGQLFEITSYHHRSRLKWIRRRAFIIRAVAVGASAEYEFRVLNEWIWSLHIGMQFHRCSHTHSCAPHYLREKGWTARCGSTLLLVGPKEMIDLYNRHLLKTLVPLLLKYLAHILPKEIIMIIIVQDYLIGQHFSQQDFIKFNIVPYTLPTN